MRFAFILLILFTVSPLFSFPYFEGFEDESAETLTLTGDWEVGDATNAPHAAFQGTSLAATSIMGPYSNGSNSEIITPAIVLPDTTGLVLDFMECLNYESGYDHPIIQIEINRSGTWSNLRADPSNRNTWQRTFVSLDSYAGSTIRIRFLFTSDLSVTGSGWYIDNVQVHVPPGYTLTQANNPFGSTTPSQNFTYTDSLQLSATPIPGYIFDRWSVMLGAATFSDTTHATTMVYLQTNATVKALYRVTDTYALTDAPSTINYTLNATEGGYAHGVWMSYSAPDAGNYRFIFSHVEASTVDIAKFSDTLFNEPDTLIRTSLDQNIDFTTYEAGETRYFFASPQSSLYQNNNALVSVVPTLKLTFAESLFGSYASSSLYVVPGNTISTTVEPNTGYLFSHWSITSGSATMVDSTSQTLEITISTDTQIQAHFVRMPATTITDAHVRYNFTTDALGADPDLGQIFEYTPPDTGLYVVTLKQAGLTPDAALLLFTDSTYTIHSNTSATGTVRLTLHAQSPSETFYIKALHEGANPTNSFDIFADTAVSVSLAALSNGTVSPSDITRIALGDSLTISAFPNSSFLFSEWAFVDGASATINDNTMRTTLIIPTEDVSLKASFIYESPHVLTTTPTQYHFTSDASNGNYAQGVLFSFIAPHSGTYRVTLANSDGSNSKTLVRYLDSAFTSTQASTYGPDHLYLSNVAAQSSDTLYFKAAAFSAESATKRFMISISEEFTVVTSSIGQGSTTPASSVVASGTPFTLSATPSAGYTFSHWVRNNSNTTITDSTDKTTTANITESTHIRGVFSRTPTSPITETIITYNFSVDASDNNYLDGVFFEYIAPSIGEHTITIADAGPSANKYITVYGDTTYMDSQGSASGTGTKAVTITSTIPGQKFYVRVRVSSSTYKLYNFTISASEIFTLNVLSHGHGTTNGGPSVLSNASTMISATPSKGYQFTHWQTMTGDVVIDTPTNLQTLVTLNSNAVVQGSFERAPLNTLSISEETYNYNADALHRNYAEGVWFDYTPATTEKHLIQINSPSSQFVYLEFFDNDTTYISSDLHSSVGSTTYPFNATTGTTVYFRVYTTSVNKFNNFTIQMNRALTLSLDDDGHGSVHADEVFTLPGGVLSINASHNPGYLFSHWERTRGGCIVEDVTATTTTATLLSDCAVKAHFTLPMMHPISSTPARFNLTDDALEDDPDQGVWFQFIPQESGDYQVSVNDLPGSSTEKRVLYFGTALSNTPQEVTGTGIQDLSINVEAVDEPHFIKVISEGDPEDNISISIEKHTSTGVLYSTGFEQSYTPLGASAELLFIAEGSWQTGASSPHAGPRNAQEGVQLAGTVISDSYPANRDDALTTHTIVLPAGAPIMLSFYSWLIKEDCCDAQFIEVKRASESLWTPLNSSESSLARWAKTSYALNEYLGDTISIRFRFKSDGSQQRDGWYIDNIIISQIRPDSVSSTGEVYNTSGNSGGTTSGGATGTSGTGPGSGTTGTVDPGGSGTGVGGQGPSDSTGVGGSTDTSSVAGGSDVPGGVLGSGDSTDTTTPLDTNAPVASDSSDSTDDFVTRAHSLPALARGFSTILPLGEHRIHVPLSVSHISVYSVHGVLLYETPVTEAISSFTIPKEVLTEGIHYLRFNK